MQKLQYVFMALAVLCFAIPAFADGGSAAINLVPIGAGIGMGLAAGLCGVGQGKAVASATEALARNPGGPRRNPDAAGSRSGFHRVPHPFHSGYHLRQGQVSLDCQTDWPRPMGGANLFCASETAVLPAAGAWVFRGGAQHLNCLLVAEVYRHGHKLGSLFGGIETLAPEKYATGHDHLEAHDPPLAPTDIGLID